MAKLVIPGGGNTSLLEGLAINAFRVLQASPGATVKKDDAAIAEAIVALGEYRSPKGSPWRKLSFTSGAGDLHVEVATDDKGFGQVIPWGPRPPERVANGVLTNQPVGTSTVAASVDVSPYRYATFMISPTLDAGTAKARVLAADVPSGQASIGNMDGTAAASGSYSGVMLGETALGFGNVAAFAYRARKISPMVVYAVTAGINSTLWEVWGFP